MIKIYYTTPKNFDATINHLIDLGAKTCEHIEYKYNASYPCLFIDSLRYIGSTYPRSIFKGSIYYIGNQDDKREIYKEMAWE
jgi:hypothetical protein